MWAIKELSGKYYGTEVQYEGVTEFKIWTPDHFAQPFGSEREIANGWVSADGHDHVEDTQSLTLAREIVSHLNSIGFKLK